MMWISRASGCSVRMYMCVLYKAAGELHLRRRDVQIDARVTRHNGNTPPPAAAASASSSQCLRLAARARALTTLLLSQLVSSCCCLLLLCSVCVCVLALAYARAGSFLKTLQITRRG
ncbi:hypothetical protein TSAR_010970 [Trichomalopsis sarcophagae]|uniref:Uncharacterized protein n=1 Tax=Trichomalopsis sarcophagae TaxID=543379 RepID=A0A232F5Y0_9HYME|nr:hypothetical protein TSAR_010970 [Trichomalopsis sarcophagae]